MVYTYLHMIEGCRKRESQGWEEFGRRYAPLARHWLAHYFPNLSPQVETALEKLFRKTLENEGAFFTGFSGRSEHEFQAYFRDFVLAVGPELAPAAPDTPIAAPPVTLETVAAALKDFPAYPKQAFWLYVLGYGPEALAPMLNMKPAAATEAMARGQEALRSRMEDWSELSLRQSALTLAREARASRSESCPQPLVWHRIVDGQITWRERENALDHVASCWHCVDRFSTFQEAVYLGRKLEAAGRETVERIQKAVGAQEGPKKKKGIFG